MPKIGKPVSIRFSLLRSFMVLILVSSLTVLILMTIRARRTEEDLSEQLISRGMLQATQELDRFFQPAQNGSLIAAQWGSSGQLNLEEVVAGQPGKIRETQVKAAARLNSLLAPFLRFLPEISSLQIANDRGDGFLILQLESGRMKNRIVSRERWGTQTLWFDIGEDRQPVSPEWKVLDYDPRKRAWYAGLKNMPYGKIFWTEPYIFFTTKDLGITASIKWQRGGLDYVIAYDILLTTITEFTQRDTSQSTKNSQMAIFTEDWQVVGLPRHQNYRDPESIRRAFLLPVGQLDTPAFLAAVTESRRNNKVRQAIKEKAASIFRFQSEDETWWAGVCAYPLGTERQWWISVLVPNRDLLEGISQLRIYVLVATVVALAAALIYAFLLARSYSQPLEALATQSRRIRNLDFHADEKIEAKLSEFKQLAEAQEQSLTALRSFARYVPVEVVKELVEKGEVARIGGSLERLTILFTDIADFTKISEAMPPEALANHMAEYFQALIDILHKYRATVDKMVGDAIVAFWGAPNPMRDQAEQSVQAVLECRDQLEALNTAWSDRGLPALPTRFGLATGPVVVGNIGAKTRLSFTVLGDTVNLASRIESLNKVYGTKILVDEHTREDCRDRFEWRRLDRIIVVGKTEPTTIFEVLGEAGTVAGELLAAAQRYEKAWEKYQVRDFDGALQGLTDFEGEFGENRAVQRLREICDQYRQSPPPPSWDGTSQMTMK